MKTPVVELSACIRCGVCVEVCPQVFLWNPAGYIEVAGLPFYPEEGVNEAVKHCPTRCIYWDETQERIPPGVVPVKYRSPGAGKTMKALKARIARLLEEEPFETGLSRILALPPRRAVNPLFSFLYSIQEPRRWRAVTAMGAVVAAQAESDMEGARVVMRRLMWNLNDESGGIGWGSAEAMGEICARSPRLAAEFAKILVSYIDPKGNFMENPALQPGVLWGIGRVARMNPDQIRDAAPLLVSFLRHSDPVIRGLAAWTASFLQDPHLIPHLSALSRDPAAFTLFLEARPVAIRIRDLARRGTTAGPEESPSIQDTLL